MALAITLYTIGNKSVYAFTLKYVPQTPSYVSKLYLEEFINSTGRDYVYLRVSTFTYTVSGAYFTVKCNSPYGITPTGISFKVYENILDAYADVHKKETM